MSDIAKKFEQGVLALHRQPQSRPVMDKFRQLHDAALADGALDRATKELLALAISIATHCEGCIAWHVQAATQAGATPNQVAEAIGVAVLMGGGPATYYGSMALTELHDTQ